jgi:predicted transcriptional regulator
MYYMSMLTIRIDDNLEEQLDAVCRRSGRSKSAVVRDALRRHLVREEFRRLRAEIMPLAEARGYVTDEDVFEDVS